MRGRGCENRVGLSKISVNLFEPFQKARQSPRADRDMLAYFHVPPAPLARRHFDALAISGIFNQQQFVGQLLPKAAMDLADTEPLGCPTAQPPAINPSLNLDTRLGFELQVSFAGVRAVIVL